MGEGAARLFTSPRGGNWALPSFQVYDVQVYNKGGFEKKKDNLFVASAAPGSCGWGNSHYLVPQVRLIETKLEELPHTYPWYIRVDLLGEFFQIRFFKTGASRSLGWRWRVDVRAPSRGARRTPSSRPSTRERERPATEKEREKERKRKNVQ